LKWKKNKKKAKDDRAFIFFTRQIFRFSNKNLSNALQLSFKELKKEFKWKLDKKAFKEKISKLKIPETKVDQTEVEVIVEIFNAL